MNYWVLFGTAMLLLVLFDLPYLTSISNYANKVFTAVQGSPLQFRYEPGIIVYAALAYLVLQTESAIEAFKYGAATYAVYDFTNLATLKQYDLQFALMDTLWGGILFAATRYTLGRIFNV